MARAMPLRRATRPGVFAMAKSRPSPTAPTTDPAFDLRAFLASAGVARAVTTHDALSVIFFQGDACRDVRFLEHGSVKLSVVSRTGKEAIVAILGPGNFFGEGCLAGQPRRIATALALSPSRVLAVEKDKMLEMLRLHPAVAGAFLAHMLTRNIRIEEDLVDHLFNGTEKRLARVLLLLARYGTEDEQLLLPRLSQGTLAGMVGTTRSRVNFLMNKFRDLGFIEYDGQIKVNRALLTVVLHD
jgi:CRP/FNR family transcriptional regulator, cyclic AMP receptor protein